MGKFHRSIALAMLCLAACSSASGEEDGSGDTSSSEDKLLAGRKIPSAEVARILTNAGFPDDMLGPMVCTAKYESSFFERASNKNKNGTVDRGLLQVNSTHLGHPSCPRTAEGLYDANTNAKCALVIWSEQGIGAWYGYKKHRAECDAYEVGDDP